MIEKSKVSPQIDLTAVNAVQSLFDRQKLKRDPWGAEVAADFIDFVLWNDNFRFPVLLLADADQGADALVVPALLDDLNRREPGLAVADVRTLDYRPMLDPEFVATAWRTFAAFIANNSLNVKGFLALHASPWIRAQILSRLPGESQYVFDPVVLDINPEISSLAARLAITSDEVYYLFDLVLKYLLYAEQAQGQYYLSHPIRAKLDYKRLTAIEVMAGPRREVPFRLGPYLVAAARSRDQDWFTSRLHEARAFVRETGMTDITGHGSIGTDELRQLAVRLGLPASIRNRRAVDKTAAVASAAAGIAGSFLTADVIPAVIGSTLSVATKLWSGNVPASAARVTWLQWMFEWPIEHEAEGG